MGTPGPRPAPLVLEMVQSVLCTREAAGAGDPGPRDWGEDQPGVLTWSAQWQDPGEGLRVPAAPSGSRTRAATVPCDSCLS